MNAVEKIIGINEILKDVFQFVQEDDVIKPDFQEYLSTMGAMNATSTQMEKIFIPYIFERYLGEPAKNIIEQYNERGNSSKEVIAKSFLTAQYSIFKVKRLLRNGFKLYNLTNEKEYEVLSLTKMTNFRGIGIGDFIVARIFKLENEYYLIGIDNVLSSSQEEDATRYAVVRIVQAPWLVYEDNAEKENEIKQTISETYDKFIEIYKTDEIITTNKYADDIIGQLSEDEAKDDFNLDDAIKPIEQYKYFEIKELENDYSNFIENSLGGFSSHKETYDVGIIMDKEFGIYTIPFYKTFCMIFEDGNKVENKSECINYFLNNDSVSDSLLKRVASKYPNFMEVINKELGSEYTLETLIQKFKMDFLRRKIYSSTSVLFHSNVFSTSLGLLDSVDEFVEANS
ncbi:MAG: hypothetical protein ACI4S3_01310 [Candidatus Gastranaerophilaceae bacterium]